MKIYFGLFIMFILFANHAHGVFPDLRPEDFKDGNKKDGAVFSDNGIQYRIVNRSDAKGVYIKISSSWKKHGTYYEFNSKGDIIKKTPYINGDIHGLQQSYTNKGILKYETPYIKNLKHGVEKIYLDDGRIFSETPYFEGHRHGKSIQYTPIKNGVAKEFETDWVLGFMHGEVVQYNLAGKIISRSHYENGKQIGKTIWTQ